jgi:molecular chaperone Hsp33
MVTQSSTDRWMKCISTQGNIRGVAIQATELVQEMADRHQLKGRAIQGLGEAVMSALLVASYCRVGQRVNLNVQGSGAFKQALVDAYPDGTVRGYLIERSEASSPPSAAHAQEETGPWGEGYLSVLRTRETEPGGRPEVKPYIGTVPLLTGHLAKDLSFYWVQSEQIPSAVGLAVNLEGDRVLSAGGFLVQALPGASAMEVRALEHHIHEIESLARTVAKDASPIHLLSQIFQSTAFVVVEERSLRFQCNCSWERVQRALVLLGVAELEAILKEDQVAVVKCDFCSMDYRLSESELRALIDQIKAASAAVSS